MALRVLMLRKQRDDLNKKLKALVEKKEALEKREAEAAEAIEQLTEESTEEEKAAVSEEVDAIEAEKDALEKEAPAIAALVEPLESVIDALTEELKVRHIDRLQAGGCTLELGFIYNDCLNNLERVADHCSNIAFNVMEAEDTHLKSHSYLRSLKQSSKDEYKENKTKYAKKYHDRLQSL